MMKAMSRSEVDERLGVQALSRNLEAADRLVRSAAEAVTSFVKEGGGYFLRDTTEDALKYPFSTGGAAVVADLWDVGSQFPYLSSVIGRQLFKNLEDKRDQASALHASDTFKLDDDSAPTFGPFNPFTSAILAYLLARSNPKCNRAAPFALLALHAFGHDWPVLDNVDHPHPYVAARVFRAARHLDLGKLRSSLPPGSATLGSWLTNIKCPASPATLAKFEQAFEAVRSAKFKLEQGRSNYSFQAKAYLWQQHGYSVPGSSSAPNSLSYDPVGACFALEILIETQTGIELATDAVRQLAEFEDLIQLSVRHVLTGMSPTGSLAYGLPFSYNPKGMGAFATSISGLASLAQSLYRILELSRKSSYGNATFIDELLRSNAALFAGLFALPSTLEGYRRSLSKDVLAIGQPVLGWSTDRAASSTRVESWVSMDVLRFAMFARLLIQEVAEFQILQRYSATRVRGEPGWPYAAGAPVSVLPDVGVMQDPDELATGAPGGAPADELAPVRCLHRALDKRMQSDDAGWENQKSAFLLFGPPGTAKTTIAKALAQRLGWHYLELSPSNFVDQGLEMIERRSREVFDELGLLREAVVLFDELDSLLIDREQLDPSSILNFTVPAMLPKLQRLSKIAKKQRLVLVFATNFYDRLDPAMVRRGRVDERLLVLPHNSLARRRMLSEKLTDPHLSEGIKRTPLAVWEDLKRYRDAVEAGAPPSEPFAGITPALYSSRIVRSAAPSSTRSTERLAIEVAEVVGRLLDEPRSLSADASHGSIVSQLRALSPKLQNEQHSEWGELCVSLIHALTSPAP